MIEAMYKMPRQLSLVKFTPPKQSGTSRQRYPFRRGVTYLFFGEIPNMPGHCVVVDRRTGRIFSGYHIENFVELDENEI